MFLGEKGGIYCFFGVWYLGGIVGFYQGGVFGATPSGRPVSGELELFLIPGF